MQPLIITVVSLEHAIAAPPAMHELVDLGAHVIWIERPGVGGARGIGRRCAAAERRRSCVGALVLAAAEASRDAGTQVGPHG